MKERRAKERKKDSIKDKERKKKGKKEGREEGRKEKDTRRKKEEANVIFGVSPPVSG